MSALLQLFRRPRSTILAPRADATPYDWKRAQMRDLLRPEMWQAVGRDREGIDFTAEEEAMIFDAAVHDPKEGIKLLRQLSWLPMEIRRRQRALAPLRSVSDAYKKSVIPRHFQGGNRTVAYTQIQELLNTMPVFERRAILDDMVRRQ